MNYIDVALKSSAQINEKPFAVNGYFSEFLLNSSAEKFGIYLMTLNGSLYLCESNAESVPKKLLPNTSLRELSRKLCEGVFFFENPPFYFYLLCDEPLTPHALILLNNTNDNKGMWQTMSFFYKMLFLYRREIIRASEYDVVVLADEIPAVIKGNAQETARFAGMSPDDFSREQKTMKKIESPFLLPCEEAYGKKIGPGKIVCDNEIAEKAAFIKKHAESLQRDIDRDSPYFAELSTIYGMASKIIEILEVN